MISGLQQDEHISGQAVFSGVIELCAAFSSLAIDIALRTCDVASFPGEPFLQIYDNFPREQRGAKSKGRYLCLRSME